MSTNTESTLLDGPASPVLPLNINLPELHVAPPQVGEQQPQYPQPLSQVGQPRPPSPYDQSQYPPAQSQVGQPRPPSPYDHMHYPQPQIAQHRPSSPFDQLQPQIAQYRPSSPYDSLQYQPPLSPNLQPVAPFYGQPPQYDSGLSGYSQPYSQPGPPNGYPGYDQQPPYQNAAAGWGGASQPGLPPLRYSPGYAPGDVSVGYDPTGDAAIIKKAVCMLAPTFLSGASY